MNASEQPSEDYLIVRVGPERYALPSAAIREVARWRAPTPVPGVPPLLPGIISQRGVVLPAVDLRQLLGLSVAEPDRSSRFIIVHQELADIALLVDAALDICHLASEELARPPAGLDQQRARLLRAVAQHEGQPLLVIDLATLFAVLQEGA
ncbi:chemotaxis protein CheW [Oscillochloris sp. ZM17-4]|uniref:chemotaxis protein CheW n=1 Tax=Oscillochloris sp. ZM17-4 TaxID=2866714 RepID=UPI001C7306C0|nr:chemotaxis protein CheW [Oscillochloris sp. ZM17-4]MBX0326765.1 chemotaxis protein CheW [Oscillochloris sp. ZM17-4]